MKTTVYDKTIGKIVFNTMQRAKNLRITVRVEDVLVTVPPGVNSQKVFHFLNSKVPWILEKQQSLTSEKNGYTIFTETTQFKTQMIELKISSHPQPDFFMDVKSGVLTLKYPQKEEVTSPEVQQQFRAFIEEYMRMEAKLLLPHYLEDFSQRYGFRYNRLFIKNLKTRWGSCSQVNNINLNLHLMRLPKHLIDYVLLHELAHTIEKNHSPSFWTLLDNILGDSRKIDKELGNYHISVY